MYRFHVVKLNNKDLINNIMGHLKKQEILATVDLNSCYKIRRFIRPYETTYAKQFKIISQVITSRIEQDK